MLSGHDGATRLVTAVGTAFIVQITVQNTTQTMTQTMTMTQPGVGIIAPDGVTTPPVGAIDAVRHAQLFDVVLMMLGMQKRAVTQGADGNRRGEQACRGEPREDELPTVQCELCGAVEAVTSPVSSYSLRRGGNQS